MKRLFAILVVLSLLVMGTYAISEGDAASDVAGFGDLDNENITYLQLDAYISLIIGYNENNEVVSITSNNDEGNEFLEKYDVALTLNEPINAAINSIIIAVREDYSEEEFVAGIRYVGEGENPMEDIVLICRQAAELCNFDVKFVVEDDVEIVYSAETGKIEPFACYMCHGEGVAVCEECGGKGEKIVIVQREREVRNDYVCEVCGGKGWIDDGKHGGKKGNCDFCGGLDGKMPSGDFKQKAYDLVMVDEEEMLRCDHCDGSGEALCRICNGTGMIE